MIEHSDPTVRLLVRQVDSLRKQVKHNEELLDTLASPPWKRVWFFLQGYKLWSLGRWRKRRWKWER